MRIFILFVSFFLISCSEPTPQSVEQDRWENTAEKVTITRDKWGIAHIHGSTDADAVFGMMYAQAEDDFHRIERNYLFALGRQAEADGAEKLYDDLRMRLFIDTDVLKREYDKSEPWLQALMDAWADGLNYYLHTHPDVTPQVITRFEPWMALSFSEGSIGGDIERVRVADLKAFYDGMHTAPADNPSQANPSQAANPDTATLMWEPTGSNGFAIAPGKSASGHPLLLINPHTSFYFRAENHVSSDEGLNAYGASTWGQFFIYQGFNEHAGWMHTSSGVDNIDWFDEQISMQPDGPYYKYGDTQKKLETSQITLKYKTDQGMAEKTFTAYHTHRGPIIAGSGDTWQSVALMNSPRLALAQSYGRTKSTGFTDYINWMRNHTNSSNNTVYADKDGTIAYFHSNFIPRRDDRFDFTRPVDGSNPATDWTVDADGAIDVHTIEETVNVINPPEGWVQNTNNWPWSVTGANSPQQADYPRYFDRFPENYRGVNAVKLLKEARGVTLDGLIALAYDPYLAAFDDLLPVLFAVYENSGDSSMDAPINALKAWDRRSGVDSIPTSLAIFWGQALRERALADTAGVTGYRARGITFDAYMIESAGRFALDAFRAAISQLENDFGTWQTPWGEINRFQRLTGDIIQPFDDSQPSFPVGFASARWGSLAAYGQRTFNDTKKIYGTRGNSFVAVVEFGKDRVQAKAVSAGGQSGNPASPHFADQAALYASGTLRDVYFYPEDIKAVAEEVYQPGARSK